jgi:N-methylhydantoinase A
LCAPLERTARADLRGEGLRPAACTLTRTVDVRYQGQSFEIPLPLTANLRDVFHRTHRALYGYADHARPLEVVNVRVRATGRQAPSRAHRFTSEACHPFERQRIRWDGRWMPSAVHARSRLAVGTTIRGPAVIVEFSATTVLPPHWRATVHPSGHFMASHGG